MGEYTLLAIAAPVLVVALEVLVLRTGLFRRAQFWLAIGIVLAFQIPVDGWLTKPGGTVVHYHPDAASGYRPIWNIPVEDFGFGFALVASTLLVWQWWKNRVAPAGAGDG